MDLLILMSLLVLVPSIIALVQEKADKVSVTALVVALCGAAIVLIDRIYDLLNYLPHVGEVAVRWIVVVAMSVAAIVAGVRIRNRTLATLMITGAVVCLLVLLRLLELKNF